jgi:hypothetical protein
MIRRILLLLVADARDPTFHRASVALRAYPAVEPPGLRVKGVQGAEGVFEMTWADDGRATFEHGSAVHVEETPSSGDGSERTTSSPAPECGSKRTFGVDHSSPREAFEGIADR